MRGLYQGVPPPLEGLPAGGNRRRLEEVSRPPLAEPDALEADVQAHPGDHLLIEGTKVGAHRRDGQIVECQGTDGGPPFLVHWNDTGSESLVYPGPDAHITTAAPDQARPSS